MIVCKLSKAPSYVEESEGSIDFHIVLDDIVALVLFLLMLFDMLLIDREQSIHALTHFQHLEVDK